VKQGLPVEVSVQYQLKIAKVTLVLIIAERENELFTENMRLHPSM
jgi:hypothetical protein